MGRISTIAFFITIIVIFNSTDDFAINQEFNSFRRPESNQISIYQKTNTSKILPINSIVMETRSSVDINFSIGTINTVNRISTIEKVGLNLIMIGYVVLQAC